MKVWSPAGGWWNTNKNWRVNTAIAFGIIGTLCIGTFTTSAQKERRPIAPKWHIPSQRWALNAEKDDPTLRKGY
ncbi:hypothetical protein ScalyP_jg6186 [Parmales sp. scaly parma]|nr:hypothetical protein ScalyP_jg6186 [Parmales sp. scaly parma]